MSWTLEIKDKVLYEAQPRQDLFHDATADEILYGGQAGGGKSKAIIADAIGFAAAYPGVRVGLFRRTYPELAKSLVVELRKTLPYNLYRYNKSDHVAQLPNGSTLDFNYCQNEDDVFRYQSVEYDREYFDEVTHFTPFQYTYLLSRLRTTRKDIKAQVKSGSNPGNVGHQFIKGRFIDGADPEVVTERVDPETGRRFTTVFIPAKIADNKYITDNDPDYINRLLSLPEHERRMLLEGDWSVFAGQVFSEFRYDRHVIQPFELPKEWKRFRALDWGYNAPHSVGWYAISPDKHLYKYRELYGKGKTDEELAKQIKDLESQDQIHYGVADPSIFSKGAGLGESIADRMSKQGVYFNAADNDRINGLARVHTFLSLAPDGKPWLQVFSTCTNTIRTLPALVYDRHRVDDLDTDGEDHAYDETRYAVMSRPSPLAPKEVKAPKNSMFGYIQKKQQQRWLESEYVGY